MHFAKLYVNKPTSLMRRTMLYFAVATIPVYVLVQISQAFVNSSSRTMKFSYAFTVRNIPKDARHIQLWAPVPQSDEQQQISNLEIESALPYDLQQDSEFKNTILSLQTGSEVPQNIRVAINFVVRRNGYSKLSSAEVADKHVSQKELQRYLMPDKLVPIDGKIAEEAKKVVRKDMTTLEKGRAIYEHVVKTLSYDKSGSGWGRGDAIYACDVRKGNCTDFHSLFIGMARASGIPARFVIGFPVPPVTEAGEIAGYHCWAEFYVEGKGWLPVDASEASKHPEKTEALFGGLDADRVQFTTGRDIRMPDTDEDRTLNYFIYPYVLVNGKPYSDIQREIHFTDLKE